MLEALGHKVVAVDGGASAFNEMSKQHFDIVFTDLSMPQIDGWEIAHFIRSQWDDTNIVMVTGYGVGVQSPNGELDLIDGVIGKPFDFDQVTETISQVMLNSKRTPIPINTQHDESAMVH
jgi:two-component system capsular synthesis sensor histidine kinase RcsC